jgi:hypothetical protein
LNVFLELPIPHSILQLAVFDFLYNSGCIYMKEHLDNFVYIVAKAA